MTFDEFCKYIEVDCEESFDDRTHQRLIKSTVTFTVTSIFTSQVDERFLTALGEDACHAAKEKTAKNAAKALWMRMHEDFG